MGRLYPPKLFIVTFSNTYPECINDWNEPSYAKLASWGLNAECRLSSPAFPGKKKQIRYHFQAAVCAATWKIDRYLSIALTISAAYFSTSRSFNMT